VVAAPDLPLWTRVIKGKHFTLLFRTWSTKKKENGAGRSWAVNREVPVLGVVGGLTLPLKHQLLANAGKTILGV